MDMLKTILADVNITCFADIYQKLKEIGNDEKNLITNAFVLCILLIINPATTLKKDLFNYKTLQTWLRSTVTNRRFNRLGLLNVHKEPTDKLDLVEVGNEFT